MGEEERPADEASVADLALVVDYTSDVLLLLDEDARIRWCSPSVSSQLGYHPDDVRARPALDFVHPEDRAVASAALAGLFRGPRPEAPSVVRVRHAMGQWRWVEVLGNQVRDEGVGGGAMLSFRDITSRVEMQRRLEVQETWFRALVDHSAECFISCDDVGRVTFASPALRSILGREPADLIGTIAVDLIHPEDRRVAQLQMRDVQQRPGVPVTVELRVRHADGSWRWVRATSSDLRHNPRLGQFLCTFADVTDRREAELQLQEAIAHRDAFLASSPDVIGLVSTDGSISWLSPATENVLGFAPEELVGGPALSLVHPDDLEKTAERFATTLHGSGLGKPLQVRARHKAGHWLPVEGLGTTWYDIDGEPAGLVFTIRDVSEQVAKDEALHRSEDRFRALVENSSDAIILVDESGEIEFATPSLANVFGRPLDEIVGRAAEQFVHDEDRAGLREEFVALLGRPGATEHHDLRVIDGGGELRWVEVVATNHLETDAVGAIVANVRDITDRRRAEVALRASEAHLRAVVQNSFDVIAIVDETGTVTSVTPDIVELLGRTAEELTGSVGLELVHPDDRPEADDELAALVAGRERAGPLVVRMRRADDSWHYVELAGTNLLRNPDIGGIVVTLRDADERITSERELVRLSAVADASHDVIAIADGRGRLVYLNDAGRRFFGVDATRRLDGIEVGQVWEDIISDAPGSALIETLWGEGSWRGEFRLRRHDGELVPVMAQLLAHRDDDERAEFYSAVMRDISERSAFEHQLRHAASHDSLTDLANREALFGSLDEAMTSTDRRLGILFVDLDDFKVVNDRYGHAFGDSVLEAVARRLRSAVRPDDLVSRFGGDEFVVLCREVGAAEAEVVAGRIIAAFGSPFVLDDRAVRVGGSIGIALGEDSLGAQELLGRADTAMYEAKNANKGGYRFWSG